MAVYVLDTSAVTAFLKGEPGEDVVDNLLGRARDRADPQVILPFLVPMEIEYTPRRAFPGNQVNDWLDLMEDWPVEVRESDYAWRRTAAQVKLSFSLSLADAWIASLALLNDAELVHKDPEFDAVTSLKHLRLPYTPTTGRRR
jgi:predicted nucleic acid-binding protein